MTAIDRTIYRRMKRSYTPKELIEAYTPTEEERQFVGSSSHWYWWRSQKSSLNPPVGSSESCTVFQFATNTTLSEPACS